jgi:hypothetical protein
MRKMTEESIDVSQLRTIKESSMLEGAIGYIAYLQDAINKGKFKTVNDISQKISDDWALASSALSQHFRDKLKIAGWPCGLFEETKEKKAEKHD